MILPAGASSLCFAAEIARPLAQASLSSWLKLGPLRTIPDDSLKLLKAKQRKRKVGSVLPTSSRRRGPPYPISLRLASSETNEALVRQLSRLTLSRAGQYLLCGAGTGKTHIATALGVHASEHYRTRSVLLNRRKLSMR